jgi:hypothetical protein
MLTENWSLRSTLYAGESTTTTNEENPWVSSWGLVSGVVDFVCWDCSPDDSDKVTPGALQLQFRASHRDFELALMEQLKDATYCDAFDHITDLKVHYGDSADTALLANKNIMLSDTSADTPVLLANKKKKTIVRQEETNELAPVSVDLIDVNMDTMNADCMGILSAAIVQEYNTIHNSDDYTLVEASFTTETFIPPETSGDETGLGYVNFLVKPIKFNTSWGKHQGYLEHRCRMCDSDNRDGGHTLFPAPTPYRPKFPIGTPFVRDPSLLRQGLGVADKAGLATTTHELFESKVLATLKASSCEAFSGLANVKVSLGFATSVALVK